MVLGQTNQAITGFKPSKTLCNKHLQTGCKNMLNPYNERKVKKAYGEWFFRTIINILVEILGGQVV